MRGLDKVELVKTNRSSTGWAVRIGPGATWERVEIVKHKTKQILVYMKGFEHLET